MLCSHLLPPFLTSFPSTFQTCGKLTPTHPKLWKTLCKMRITSYHTVKKARFSLTFYIFPPCGFRMCVKIGVSTPPTFFHEFPTHLLTPHPTLFNTFTSKKTCGKIFNVISFSVLCRLSELSTFLPHLLSQKSSENEKSKG